MDLLNIVQQYVASLLEATQALGAIAPVGALLLVVLANLFCVPITAVCAVICGFLFGAERAAALVVTGMAVGATLLFLSVRHYKASVYQHFLSRASTLANDLRQFGWTYLLILHILPGIPTCLISMAAALGSVSSGGFFLATLLGSAPGTIFLTIAGERLKHLSDAEFTLPPVQMAALVAFAGIVLGAYALSKRWYDR